MAQRVAIAELMATSGVAFGTSGARGLVADMTDAVCYAYTAGFIQYLESAGELPQADRRIAIAGDYRPSTQRIMGAVAQAVSDRGYQPVNGGCLPSPAIANYGLREGIPAIMITGSHIPADRNGIKFNTAAGEVLKTDEAGMLAQTVALPDRFDAAGMLRTPVDLGPVDATVRDAYLRRYLDAFPAALLQGMRIGFYQHSAVGRDLLCEIYEGLGATVTPLGRSDSFIPVDTEAILPEDVRLAAEWAAGGAYDALLSTDGDSDRPLISDETGTWLRGDVAGILTARYCGAEVVVAPVSCNTAVERSGWFRAVRRTRIGSPYVIAEMQQAVADGARVVVGYEANGGFLTATDVATNGGTLPPLPTRDPVIVHLAILALSRKEGKTISQLLAELPQRVTASDRLQAFPTALSQRHIAALTAGGAPAIETMFPEYGPLAAMNTIDGLRMTFASGDIIHLRPSGNAPELRCYTEADSETRAHDLLRQTLAKLESWRAEGNA